MIDTCQSVPRTSSNDPLSIVTGETSLRVAIYLRVSTGDQVQGHSLDAQRNSTHLLVQRRGWVLVEEYVDAGRSAKPGAHRPALEQLLQDAQRGLFDVVVVDKVDRFYRHLRGLLQTLDTLNEADVSFISVRENIDLSTPWGKLTLTMLGMLAEIYIDNLRQETRKGLLQRAREGLHNGRIPFGYCDGICSECNDPNGEDYCPLYGGEDRSDGVVAVSHPIEADAVRKAFAWYLTGRYSDGKLAERLNDHEHTLDNGTVVHFRTKGVPGRYPPGRISKSSVRHILQHPFYAGVIPYYGRDEEGKRRKRDDYDRLFPGQHEGLITMEDFEQAQAIREQSARRSRCPETGKLRIHPLSGILVCGYCGGAMRATTTGDGYRYYRDANQIEHRCDCPQPMLKAEDIEKQVVAFLHEVSQDLPVDWQKRVEEEVISQREQEEWKRQEKEVKERIKRATKLHLKGHVSYDRFLEEKRAAQAALAHLRPSTLDGIIELGRLIEKFDHQWRHTMDMAQKNGLLRLVLAEAQVKGKKLTTVRPTLPFYPLVGFVCRSGADGRSVIR
jgi:site-specific DNA recombinase